MWCWPSCYASNTRIISWKPFSFSRFCRKEATEKIDSHPLRVWKIHRSCAKEEDQKGAGWLPPCRELKYIVFMNVVAYIGAFLFLSIFPHRVSFWTILHEIPPLLWLCYWHLHSISQAMETGNSLMQDSNEPAIFPLRFLFWAKWFCFSNFSDGFAARFLPFALDLAAGLCWGFVFQMKLDWLIWPLLKMDFQNDLT